MREIVIEKNEAGQRLDKFLAKYMNEASKSFFYKMMRKKNITLNGKKAAGNEKLKTMLFEMWNGLSMGLKSTDLKLITAVLFLVILVVSMERKGRKNA